jgi:very-short-patch-repair endonuclease
MGKVVSVASKLRRDRARRLRRDQTEAEARLWEVLRGGRLEDWKWRRQAPVGPFIVDFLCLEAGLAVELGGGVHAGHGEYDARREPYLRRHGLQVLRFGNTEIAADSRARPLDDPIRLPGVRPRSARSPDRTPSQNQQLKLTRHRVQRRGSSTRRAALVC